MLAGKEQTEVVNCTDLTPYWVSWANGNLVFGKGSTEGENALITLEKVVIQPFTTLSVATSTGHSPGLWEFLFTAVEDPGNSSHKTYKDIYHQTYLK